MTMMMRAATSARAQPLPRTGAPHVTINPPSLPLPFSQATYSAVPQAVEQPHTSGISSSSNSSE